MRRQLDRSRPFGIVCGGVYDQYEQDGRLFDPSGFEIGGEEIPEKEKEEPTYDVETRRPRRKRSQKNQV
jgi:hypothetical protein